MSKFQILKGLGYHFGKVAVVGKAIGKDIAGKAEDCTSEFKAGVTQAFVENKKAELATEVRTQEGIAIESLKWGTFLKAKVREGQARAKAAIVAFKHPEPASNVVKFPSTTE